VEKSQEESKLLPQDVAPSHVILKEASSAGERETEECEGRTGLEDGEIPGGGEETKVVLLPVNPHLVYVYWELSAGDLAEMGKIFSRLGPRAQPVLRFYETANSESLKSASGFEVAIALSAGKWYVRLDHPAHSYSLDLGLRLEGDSFHLLARSNLAQMPRAFPSDMSEQRQFLVEGRDIAGEAVVPEEEAKSTSRSVQSQAKTQGPPGRRQEWGEASRTALAHAEPQDREAFGPERGGSSGSVAARAGRPREEEEWAGDLSASHSCPPYHPGQGGGETYQEREAMTIASATPPRDLERQLAEFYQQRRWEWVWWAPGVEPGEDRPAAANPRIDLTELSERSFRAGLSSSQKLP
jgi:hypothetical protein